MPFFSKRSQKKLDSTHSEFQDVFGFVIQHIDCTILSGRRGKEEQDMLFDQNLSEKEYPDSDHNSEPLSNAVDVAPYPIDWKDRERFYFFAGFVLAVAKMKGYNWYWGGDWDGDKDFKDQNFFDLPHYGRRNVKK